MVWPCVLLGDVEVSELGRVHEGVVGVDHDPVMFTKCHWIVTGPASNPNRLAASDCEIPSTVTTMTTRVFPMS